MIRGVRRPCVPAARRAGGQGGLSRPRTVRRRKMLTPAPSISDSSVPPGPGSERIAASRSPSRALREVRIFSTRYGGVETWGL
jgi:hypothetical protein